MIKVDEKKREDLPECSVFWSLKKVHEIVEPIRSHGTENLELDEEALWQKRLKIIEFLPTKSNKPSHGYSDYIGARILAMKREEFASKWSAFSIDESQRNTSRDYPRGIPFLDDENQVKHFDNFTVDSNVTHDEIRRDFPVIPEVITLDDCSPMIEVSHSTSSSPTCLSTSVNSRSDSTMIGPEFPPSTEEIERDKIRDNDVPDAKENKMDDINNVETLSPPPKSETPELLDEGVGGESHFFVKIPRKVISLNLQAYETQCVEVNLQKTTSPTEISVADSSVSDHENSTSRPVGSESDRRKDVVKSKKPTILEDVTYVEGAILGKRAFNSLRAEVDQTDEPKNKMVHGIEEQKNTIVTTPTFTKGKRRAQKIYCSRKKLRIRRTFRQLFGNDRTLSELEEEDDIIERFLGISRRKKSRNSSDSGVGLTELNPEDTYVRQSDSELTNSPEESPQSSPEVLTRNDANEAKNEPETLFRSMPLLDSLSSSSASSEGMLTEALPDSSTDSPKDCVAQADSSVPEESSSKGKLTILVSPVDVNSSDAFPPMSLEIDIPCDNQTSVPTSTTELCPNLTIPKTEESENPKENEDLPNDVEINISNDGECEVVLSPQHASNEAIVIDYSGSETLNGGHTGVTVLIAQDFSSQRDEKIALIDLETSGNSTEGQIGGEDKGDNYNEATTQPEVTQSEVAQPKLTPTEVTQPELTPTEVTQPELTPTEVTQPEVTPTEVTQPEVTQTEVTQTEVTPPVLPSSPSLPRLRVLLPSELGSRWCPTPLNNITPCCQTVPSVPNASSSWSASPVFGAHLSQGTGIPSIQPRQSPQNLPCTMGRSYAGRTTGTNTTSYKNLSNDSNCSQQGCNVPNFVHPAQAMSKNHAVHARLSLIFPLLFSLNTCLEQNKSAYDPQIAIALQNRFKAERSLLFQELSELSSAMGIYNFPTLIEVVIKNYEVSVPYTKRISQHQIFTILRTDNLPTMQRPLPTAVNFESQMYYNHLAPHPSSRPSPPSYPTFPNISYVPQNYVNSIPSYVNSRPVMPVNPDQRTFPGMSPPPVSNSSLMTPKQVRLLRRQIKIYKQLQVQSYRKPRQTRTLPTENTMPPSAPSSPSFGYLPESGNVPTQRVPSLVGSVPPLPTLVDPVLWGSQEVRNIQSPASTEPIQQHRNIPRSVYNINDSRSNQTPVTGEPRLNDSFEEILQIMALISQSTINHSNIDSNNNDNHQGTKIQASNCSSIPEKSIVSEPIEKTETTCPVEKEPCLVEKEPCPVEKEPCLVEKEPRSVEKEPCSVGERATCPVEKEITCPIIEATCPGDEEITYSVKEEATSYVEEKTTCLLEEETTCLVEEETLHGNDTEENDESDRHSNCETIEVIAEPEEFAMSKEVTTESNVSRIILNDSIVANTTIPTSEDTESNFSILEVKSITKDIFDNMNTTEEKLSDAISPEAPKDAIENHEDSMTNFELRNCLRCGEPSSVVCEQCYEAFYCSSECHEAHWTEHHYLTCKPVPAEALAHFEMS